MRFRRIEFLGPFNVFWWLPCVILRNQLWLKPKALWARRSVTRFLCKNALPFRSVKISIGLAEADVLSCLIFTSNDEELAQLQRADCHTTLVSLLHDGLRHVRYPAWAIPKVAVSFHSEETIMRAGGYYPYFK